MTLTKLLDQSRMGLFPTKDSLIEALQDIEAAVGQETAQRLFPLLMTYHNTLLKEIEAAHNAPSHTKTITRPTAPVVTG